MCTYPSLFRNRFECNNHLFNVCGNGYEWRNGELVEVDHTKFSSELHTLDGYVRHFIWQTDNLDMIVNPLLKTKPDSSINGIDKTRIKPAENIVDNILMKPLKTLIHSYLNFEEIFDKKLIDSPYNLESLSPLENMYSKCVIKPLDIKNDWKDAINEWLDFLEDRFFEIKHTHEDMGDIKRYEFTLWFLQNRDKYEKDTKSIL